MPKLTDVVWSSDVDDGEFSVMVVQDGDNTGILTVTVNETKEELIDERVTLAYGALFGPDAEDVSLWKDRAIEVIDEYKAGEW